jgi:hypothetical protein
MTKIIEEKVDTNESKRFESFVDELENDSLLDLLKNNLNYCYDGTLLKQYKQPYSRESNYAIKKVTERCKKLKLVDRFCSPSWYAGDPSFLEAFVECLERKFEKKNDKKVSSTRVYLCKEGDLYDKKLELYNKEQKRYFDYINEQKKVLYEHIAYYTVLAIALVNLSFFLKNHKVGDCGAVRILSALFSGLLVLSEVASQSVGLYHGSMYPSFLNFLLGRTFVPCKKLTKNEDILIEQVEFLESA